MFIKIKKCPFCGSKNSKGINNKELSNNFYVREILSDLKISLNLLKEKLKKGNVKIVKLFFFNMV